MAILQGLLTKTTETAGEISELAADMPGSGVLYSDFHREIHLYEAAIDVQEYSVLLEFDLFHPPASPGMSALA
jgi:hypothetical protein